MPSDHHSLAARAEAAEGPDRELDALICIAAGFAEGNTVAFKTGWCAGSETNPHPVEAPAYTASIDAALTLLPEGWQVAALEQNWRTGLWRAQLIPVPSATLIAAFDRGETVGWNTADAPDSGTGGIATPALALVAACLRARATQGENDAHR
jgi:hypothetical protein